MSGLFSKVNKDIDNPPHQLMDILRELRSSNSSLWKKSVLEKYKDSCEDFRNFIYYTYDPLVKFYIKKIPDYSQVSSKYTFNDILKSLDLLKDRKVTGNAAIDVIKDLLSNSSTDLQEIIILMINGDAKCGINVSSISDVFPGLIKEAPYQGAIAYNKKKVSELIKNNRTVSQTKADGRYANIIIRDGIVVAEARSGIETVVNGAFDYLIPMEEKFGQSCVLNGEIVIFGVSRYISNGIVSSFVSINSKINELGQSDKAVKKDIEKFNSEYSQHGFTWGNIHDKISYVVWDIIPYSVYESFGETKSDIYEHRLNFLKESLFDFNDRIKLTETVYIETDSCAMKHFKENVLRGDEGTILKSLDHHWIDGKHSHQIKFKVEIELDLIAKGFMYGEAGKKNQDVISRVCCESHCGNLKTISAGMKESMMKEITENQDKYLNSVFTIVCSGLTTNKHGEYSCLHPRTLKFRDDKTTANTLEECIDIEKAATELKK